MMRRGQTWSLDFVLSLLLFTTALILAYTIITNTVAEDEYGEVSRQAINAAEILADEGYPVHWTADTVVRAGLSADDLFSLRKADEMKNISLSNLRKSLRITDNVYIYVTDTNDTVVSIFGNCGVGDLTNPGTPQNETLPSIAITGTTHPLADLLNITVYENDTGYGEAREQDVIIIEGNISEITGMSDMEIQFALDSIAKKGITILIVGNPEIPVLGIDILPVNTTMLSVLGNGSKLGLTDGELLNISDTEVEIFTVQQSMIPEVNNYKSIALADGGETAYASWTYHDAQIWYIGTTTGTQLDGTPIVNVLANATQEMIHAPRPDCNAPEIPTNADQIAFHDRTLAHHDEIFKIRTIVWRT